jgi:hypothetical protein
MEFKKIMTKNKVVRAIVTSLSILLFLYLISVFNLYKFTGNHEFNIFESLSLLKIFIVFAVIFTVVILIESYSHRKK